MEKLTGLSDKEKSGEQPLDGLYRVTIDIRFTPDDCMTADALEYVTKKASLLGKDIEDIYVEKHSVSATPRLQIGDTIELAADYDCEKSVYLDTNGNLVITDTPVAQSVERIGSFPVSLPKGTVAEVNKQIGDNVQILFTGSSVEIAELNKIAYLGILELPGCMLIRYND